jgi:hypothetical protein
MGGFEACRSNEDRVRTSGLRPTRCYAEGVRVITGSTIAKGLWIAALGALALATIPARAGDTKKLDVTFSLSVHVAREANAPVQGDAWIDAQIARAESLFGAVGVHFRRASTKALPEAIATASFPSSKKAEST